MFKRIQRILCLVVMLSLFIPQSFAAPPAYIADSIWRIIKHESSAFDGATGSAHGDKDAANTYTIFTVTGVVLIKTFFGDVQTLLADAAPTATIKVGTSSDLASIIAVESDVDNLNAGSIWMDGGSPESEVGSANITAATAQGYIIVNGENIVETIATQDVNSGQIDYYIIWTPLEPGASVVEAGTLSQV